MVNLKKFLLVLISVIIIAAIGTWIYFAANGSPWEKEEVNEIVFKQLGISDSDLKSKDIVWESKSGRYEVYLVYKDEPNYTYSYIHRRELDKILLLSIRDNHTDQDIPKGKHDSLLNPENNSY